MRTFRALGALSVMILGSALVGAAPVHAQSAVDAAQAMASALDGAGGGISMADQLAALEAAAAAGDPMAQWQLGLMYESGEGVEQDKAKAFGYFAQIADQHADTAPKGHVPWFEHPQRQTAGVPMAFGHWSTLGLINRPDLLALDTGCVWGGALTGVRVDGGRREVIQVRCVQAQKPGL